MNVYYERSRDADKSEFTLYGTPGLALWLALSSQPVRGWRVVANALYAAAGASLYKILADKSFTVLGTLSSASGNVSMDDNGTQLLVVDGVSGYIVTLASGAFAEIADADFPDGATTCAFHSGRFLVEKPATGQFYQSASYDGTSWSATEFATAESSPDRLLAAWVDRGLVHLFGESTIEFWQNVGATNFPFAPLTGSTAQVGLAARWSLARVAGGTMFLAANNQGQVQVMRLDGFAPQRVSTADEESIINGLAVTADAVALSYVLDGHAMYQLTFPAAARSLLYDATEGVWSEVQAGIADTGRHRGQFGTKFGNMYLVSDYTNGNLYELDGDAYTDNGATIRRVVQSRHVYSDHNVVGIDELYLDVESGIGLVSGQGSDPQLMLQVSRDNGRTWGNERWASLGKLGEYHRRAQWRRLGAGRDFVFRIALSDPVKFVCTGGAVTPRMKGA